MQKINKHTLIEICMIALGCAIYGISLDMISVPNKLADGGISGISLILRHFWGINMGLSTLMLNIPLILIGYRFMGKRALLIPFGVHFAFHSFFGFGAQYLL